MKYITEQEAIKILRDWVYKEYITFSEWGFKVEIVKDQTFEEEGTLVIHSYDYHLNREGNPCYYAYNDFMFFFRGLGYKYQRDKELTKILQKSLMNKPGYLEDLKQYVGRYFDSKIKEERLKID